MFLKSTIAAASFAIAAMMAPANAANYAYTGTFSGDDDIRMFNFSVSAPSTVTLRTFSYAGGTQSNGNLVGAGGFDPVLTLFDGTGAFVIENDDGIPPQVQYDPVTGKPYDSFLEIALAAGNYILAITQWDNFAVGPNLSDGFSKTGNPFFSSVDGCSNGQFCDEGGINRTANWALDISNADGASVISPNPVPLPLAAPLFITGIGFIGFMVRRRNAG